MGKFTTHRLAEITWPRVCIFWEGNGTPLQYSCLVNPMDGGAWWAAVHGVAKSRTQLSKFTFTFHFHALEKKMTTHSSVLAWRIPGTGEPSVLPSMGSHRVRHDWSDLAAAYWGKESMWMITDLGLDPSLPHRGELMLLINIWEIPLEKSDHRRTQTCCTWNLRGI